MGKFKVRITVFTSSVLCLYCILLFGLTILEVDARLDIRLIDREQNPVPKARIQIIPGKSHPDKDILPIKPSQSRPDGLVGFVTDSKGKVSVNLPDGQYTVFASPSYDLNQSEETSFLVMSSAEAPGEVILSTNQTVPVTVSAIGEGVFGDGEYIPLEMSYVYFRPAKRIFGYVGLLDSEGNLDARISPGHYHLIIKGSISRHYLVLNDQIIRPQADKQFISFDGRENMTAQLGFNLPDQAQLVLHEILSSEFTNEQVDVVEDQIGYDAAYTDVYALDSGQFVIPTRLLPNHTYKINLSYVMNLDGHLYAYEFRVDQLKVDVPETYTIGNDGSTALKIEATTDQTAYPPGSMVAVHFKISDTIGNQLYRFFNYSSARLVFPFVVVSDPNGRVIASNPITREIPEDFFRFEFYLPETAQSGEYQVNISLDARYYGQLQTNINFEVEKKIEIFPPKIYRVHIPEITTDQKFRTQDLVLFQAQLDESIPLDASLILQPKTNEPSDLHFLPSTTIQAQVIQAEAPLEWTHQWNIPANFLVGQQLRWSLLVSDFRGNQSQESGLISTQIGNTEVEKKETEVLLLPQKTVLLAGQQQFFELAIPKTDLISQIQWFFDDSILEKIENSTNKIKIKAKKVGTSFLKVEGVFTQTGQKFTGESLTKVVFGQLAHMQIRTVPPQVNSLESGQKLILTAIGRDHFGNQMILAPKWTVDGNIGSIKQIVGEDNQVQTIFTAIQSGKGQINAYLLSQTTNLPIKVSHGKLHDITIDPFIAYLPVSSNQEQFQYQFMGHGWDLGQNPIGDIPIQWTVDQAAGNIDLTGLMTSINQPNTQTLGNVIINGTVWAKGESGSNPGKSVVVIQNRPPQTMKKLHLTLSNFDQTLDHLTLGVGEQQKFEATGTDVNNQRSAPIVSWSVNGQIGHIQPDGLFTASQIGWGWITAISEGLSATISLQITAGEPDQIVLNTPYKTLRVDENFRLTATLRDQFGNIISSHSEYRWLMDEESASVININQQGEVSALSPGPARVAAHLGNLVAQVQFFVVPPNQSAAVTMKSIKNWQIYPKPVFPNKSLKLRAGDKIQLISQAETNLGQVIPVACSWFVIDAFSERIGSVGHVSDSGLFRAMTSGKTSIKAEIQPMVGFDPIDQMAKDLRAQQLQVEVVAGQARYGQLKPQSVVYSAKSQEPIQFQLYLFDAFGNSTKPTEAPIWKVIGNGGEISQTGKFFPQTNETPSTRAQVISHLPGLNIVARATVQTLTSDQVVHKFRIAPETTEVFNHSQIQFQSLAQNINGDLVQVYPNWQLLSESPIDSVIRLSNSGQLTVFSPKNLELNQSFQVIAELDSGHQATATVYLKPDRLKGIRILADTRVVEVNQILPVNAIGITVDGREMAIQPDWSVQPAIGSIVNQDNKMIFEATSPGYCQLWIKHGGLRAFWPLHVSLTEKPPTLKIKFLSTLSSQTVTAGNEILLVGIESSIYDSKDLLSVVKNAEWRTDPQVEIRNLPDGVVSIRPTKAMEIKVFCEVFSPIQTANLTLSVVPGTPTKIQIEPSVLSLRSDTSQPASAEQFRLSLFDNFGNQIINDPSDTTIWSVSGDIGTISPSGLFEPKAIPVGMINSTLGHVNVTTPYGRGQTKVTLVSDIGRLERLEITLKSDMPTVGQPIGLTIRGYNHQNQLFPDDDLHYHHQKFPILFQVTDGIVEDNNGEWIYYPPTKQKTVRLLAKSDNIESEPIDIELNPSGPSQLIMSLSDQSNELLPDELNLSSGEYQLIHYRIIDQYGNLLSKDDINSELPTFILTNPIVGQIDQAEKQSAEGVFAFWAQKAGQTGLTIRQAGLTNTISIVVRPGSIKRLKASLTDKLLTAGENLEVLLVGLDNFDNRISASNLFPIQATILQNDLVLEKTELVLSSSNTNELVWKKSFDQAGVYQLVYETINTVQPVTTQVSFEVIPNQLATLKADFVSLIEPNEKPIAKRNHPYELVSGFSYQLIVVGKDTFGNSVNVRPSWKLTGNIGRVRSTDSLVILDTIFTGEGLLIVASAGISTEIPIQVHPYQKEISSSGGEIRSPAGIYLNVPKNAFPKDVKIKVEIIESPGMKAEAKRVTSVIKITPLQLLAKRSIQMVFDYRSTITSDFEPSKLGLYFWDSFSKDWLPISSRVDTTNLFVESKINHFGTFALMTSDQSSPNSSELIIQNIRCSPPLFFNTESNQLTITYQVIAPPDQRENSIQVTVKFFDLYGREIITLLDKSERRIGNNVEVWNGRNTNGDLCPNGRYILLILIDNGRTQAYDKQIVTIFK